MSCHGLLTRTHLSQHVMNLILQLQQTGVVAGKHSVISSTILQKCTFFLEYLPHSLTPICQANFNSSFKICWNIRSYCNPILISYLLSFLELLSHQVEHKLLLLSCKLCKDRWLGSVHYCILQTNHLKFLTHMAFSTWRKKNPRPQDPKLVCAGITRPLHNVSEDWGILSSSMITYKFRFTDYFLKHTFLRLG